MKNQSLTKESEQLASTGEKVPIQKKETELSKRLKSIIGDDSVSEFGRRCGIGEATLRNVMHNGASPRTDNLVAIADAANVSIEWLATGRGSKQRAIQSTSLVNHGQIGAIGYGNTVNATAKEAVSVDVLSNALKIAGHDPKSAKIVMAVYDLLKSGAPMQQIDNLVKLMNQ